MFRANSKVHGDLIQRRQKVRVGWGGRWRNVIEREEHWNTYPNAPGDFRHDVPLGLELLVHSTANDKHNWGGQKKTCQQGVWQNCLWPRTYIFIWAYWDDSKGGFTSLSPRFHSAFDSNNHRGFWEILHCVFICKHWNLILSPSQNLGQLADAQYSYLSMSPIPL